MSEPDHQQPHQDPKVEADIYLSNRRQSQEQDDHQDLDEDDDDTQLDHSSAEAYAGSAAADASPDAESNSTSGKNAASGNLEGQPPRKRQRVRLSCLECRRRKLSCDRAFPCERCVKSGTPDRCSYESKPGPPGTVKAGIPQATFAPVYDSRRSMSIHSPGPIAPVLDTLPRGADLGLIKPTSADDRIRRLEMELSQIKAILGKATSSDSSVTLQGTDEIPVHPEIKDPAKDQPLPREMVLNLLEPGNDKVEELRFFRGKEFRTRYFGPHNACMAFSELTGLGPYMKETADEWLKPIRNYCPKDRKKRYEQRERNFYSPDPELEALLPSKEDTDTSVNVYLDQFEQVHRIVHIPTFRSQYSKFWETGETRYGAFTALVLSMMAVSICLHSDPPRKVLGPKSACHQRAETWIWACEDWLGKQSQKHRKLVHYQIACLLYLGKRVNTLKKKRFWTASGALIQDGISVGLHRDPSHMSDRITPYNQEMRRRIWATVQEFNMQASFDHGLPTLISQLHYDVNPPRNLDDDDFEEDTASLPPSKPTKEYTFSSYQHLSRQSLPLRLQLSLTLTGPPGDLDYDQVIRYTNDITHEIDALPSWDVTGSSCSTDVPNARKPLLAYTLLHIQLRQYLIPLHQPYLRLRQKNSKYQYSEIIYYNAARDMVLLHDKLEEQGIRTLYFLREDALTTAINLCSVTMLQPRGSTNMIMINSQHTLRLLEKCLSMKEDRLLRCGNNEPWGYSIMCAAYGLLEAHLGLKTTQEAKAASAQRFVDLHYKMVGGQQNTAGFGIGNGDNSVIDESNTHQQQQQRLQMGGHGRGAGSISQTCTDSVAAVEGGTGRLPIPHLLSHQQSHLQPPPPLPPSSLPHIMSPTSTLNGLPTAGTTKDRGVGSVPGSEAPPPPQQVAATAGLPTAPWLFAGGDPTAGAMMPEFNLEVLGLNLNDLWGDDFGF